MERNTILADRLSFSSLTVSGRIWIRRFIGASEQTETGPGYQVVSVMLKDGRRFDQVVTSEGCIIEVRGYAEVPFTCNEVATLTVNHRHWNFRTWSDKGKLRRRVIAV